MRILYIKKNKKKFSVLKCLIEYTCRKALHTVYTWFHPKRICILIYTYGAFHKQKRRYKLNFDFATEAESSCQSICAMRHAWFHPKRRYPTANASFPIVFNYSDLGGTYFSHSSLFINLFFLFHSWMLHR